MKTVLYNLLEAGKDPAEPLKNPARKRHICMRLALKIPVHPHPNLSLRERLG